MKKSGCCGVLGKPSTLEKHQLGLHHSGFLNFLLEGGLPLLCPTDKALLCALLRAKGDCKSPGQFGAALAAPFHEAELTLLCENLSLCLSTTVFGKDVPHPSLCSAHG